MKYQVAVAPWQRAAGRWKALQGEVTGRMGYRSDVWAAVSSVMHKRWPTWGEERSEKPVQEWRNGE